METKIPQSIQTEHEELHGELARAIKAGGKTGDAARTVLKVLQPHMAREEEFVAPALALLQPAAEGKLTEAMAAVQPRIAMLESELPRMIAEHVRIVETLRDLVRAATEENQAGIARLAQVLVAHAQQEEEILYPAALLVGRVLGEKFGKR
jgi:Hemerythrin HHE cation binding domain